MDDVLGIILGGGRGARLFPLTLMRAKPAVPIGGKYRLIDTPISNCLHAGLRRIFVLTQFNSASLNRHIGRSYHMDPFSRGFVEIIAAEQTPDNANWFQGTADAVRQALRHFTVYDANYFLILAGDHLFRMDIARLMNAHVEEQADVTIAALPVTAADATAMGLFRFDRAGQIVGFEEKPNAARLASLGGSIPSGSLLAARPLDPEKPFIASMGIYVFSRDVLLELLETTSATDFGREIIPAALNKHRVRAYLHEGYWADVGTVESLYDASILLTRQNPSFSFYDSRRPIFTRTRFLPPSKFRSCQIRDSIVAEGGVLEECTIDQSVVGLRARIGAGTRITRSVLMGADYFPPCDGGVDTTDCGIGRDVVLDRVIIDKNARIGDGARLVNEANVREKDGDGYYIRSGIVIVPKGGVIAAGQTI